ncbi:MAG: FAD-dependent oxidoreductase [Dysgonomonas sp.]
MSETIYDCVIIGGGISGISFAHYLHSIGKNTLILEKNEYIGGQLQTAYSQDSDCYWRELGSHTCYNSYIGLISIVKEIGKENQIQPLDKFKYVVYASDKIKSIFSEISILPCIFSFPKLFFADKKGKTVREYFRPLFGKSNYDRLFTNAFRAVICQKADDYPAEMFLKRRKGRDKEFPRKFTFKDGLSSFLKAIVKEDNLSVHRSAEVLKIYKVDNLYKIETKDGYSYFSRNIAIATNPQIASALTKNIEPNVSTLLSTIPLFNSESLNITIPKEKLSIKNIAGIISLSDEFMSAVSRDLVYDEKLRSFTFHFEKGKKSKQEKIDLICKVLNISQSDILEIASADHTLASARMKHLHMDEQIDKVREDKNIYILGNYYYGLSLEDCINRSLDEFERFKEQYK